MPFRRQPQEPEPEPDVYSWPAVLVALENAPGVTVEGERVSFARKRPPVQIVLIVAAVALLGVAFQMPEIALLLGGVVVFVGGMIAASWNLGRQPAVVVDEVGVHDHVSAWGFGLIEWHEIERVHGAIGAGGPVLVLVLTSKAPTKRGSLLRRIFRKQSFGKRPDRKPWAGIMTEPLLCPWEEFAGTVFQHPRAQHIRDADIARGWRRLQ